MDWMKCDQDKKPQVITDTWLRDWTEAEDVKDKIKVESATYSNEKHMIKLEDNNSLNSEAEGDFTTKRQPKKLNNVNKQEKILSTAQIGQNADKIIKELCKGAPVDKSVSNMCEYQCPECGDKLFGWAWLKRHYRKQHVKKNLSLDIVAKTICKTVSHTCRICSAKLLCDCYFIQRHLLTHKLMVKQYVKKFKIGAFGTLPNTIYSNNVIGNYCEYKCCECIQTCTGRTAMTKHFAKHYKGKRFNYEECLKKSVYHICKLCNKSILCDQLVLKNHIKRSHNITLDQYCTRTKTEIDINLTLVGITDSYIKSLKISNNIHNSCVFVCTICKENVHSLRTFKQHMVGHKLISLKPMSTYLVKSLSYKCLKCSKLLLCDKQSIQEHMRHGHHIKKENELSFTFAQRKKYSELCESFRKRTPISLTVKNTTVLPVSKISMCEITSTIGDLCLFKCTKCHSMGFLSWRALRKHYKTVHSSGLTYNASLVMEARYHACLLCPKAILNDRYFLHQHLPNCHKIKIHKYERIFRKNGGETLPTFNAWLQQTLKPVTEVKSS